jgi:hypothetical protein
MTLTYEQCRDRIRQEKTGRTSEKYVQNLHNFIKKVGHTDEDLSPLFADVQGLLNSIVSMYNTPSTRRSYFATMNVIVRAFFNSPENLTAFKLSNAIEFDKENTINTGRRVEAARPISEAHEIMASLVKLYDDNIGQISKKDYDTHRQACAFARICLDYGVMRPDEWNTLHIVQHGGTTHENFIDLQRRRVVIKRHKTSRGRPEDVREFVISRELAALLKPGIGGLILPKLGERINGYASSTGLEKRVRAMTGGHSIYDYRRAKTSVVLDDLKTGKINSGVYSKFAKVQGHSYATQLSFYNRYSLPAPKGLAAEAAAEEAPEAAESSDSE